MLETLFLPGAGQPLRAGGPFPEAGDTPQYPGKALEIPELLVADR
jgi:hypothetical protein